MPTKFKKQDVESVCYQCGRHYRGHHNPEFMKLAVALNYFCPECSDDIGLRMAKTFMGAVF